ncbi:hypothetical protein TL16_g00837 [Triparma laevis f. inornata]|uniref:Uncharacterized protein n=2 Tax=Triparma laevis TaxID=1534972 RepID=A0A9W7FBQ1_9STRA|nr:hypothetical protein TL16_g00837 [Triparma laevis f. inornata]GMI09234.1 hypothetical protein TrLO_g2030 [Triparma laevis f. longispina]
MWSSSTKRGGGARFGPGHRTISNDESGPPSLAKAFSSDFTPAHAQAESEDFLTSPCRICRSVLDRLERMERDRNQIKAALISKEKELLKAGVAKLDPTHSAPGAEDELMKAAGKQIAEANARHRTLAAEMEKESLRWRNDMAMKVAKYALMCKELSEDNARAKEALRFSKEEIARLEIERNGLAKLNQKFLVSKSESEAENENDLYSSSSNNNSNNSNNSSSNNNNNKMPPNPLTPTPTPNNTRVIELESIVEKLASRLEQAMSIIQKLQEERKLLRERERAAPGDAGGHSAMLVKTLSAQLSNERTICKNALLQVSKARTESLAQEGELLEHIKLLEEELKRSLQARRRIE